MILDFSQNNMNVIFEVTDTGSLALKEFSHISSKSDMEKKLKWCPACEIHISGENMDDHHGAKHTGTYGSYSLKYKKHSYRKTPGGNKLEIFLEDSRLSATLHYEFYDGIAAVRAWTVVANISDEPVGLEYVSSFSYTGFDSENPDIYIPHNSWCTEVNWRKESLYNLGYSKNDPFTLKRVCASNTGAWSSKEYLPMGVMESKLSAIMWQIDHNGSWNWEIGDISDMIYLKLSGPSEQENGWYKELECGETFESVKVCIAVGENFNDALEQMTHYRRQISNKCEIDKEVPVIFNDYMNCLFGDPTTEKLIPVIDKAALTGAKYFCIDAGWYAEGNWWDSVGEWKPNNRRFPGGFKEVIDYIRSKKMIPGIWLEIEVMGIKCPILNQFEDECFFMRHGKKVADHGRYQLDFRHPKVRRFASSVIDRVVGEYGVGYIKMDYNIEPGAGTEINSDSFGDGLLEHNRAYLSWVDEIKSKYPNLILENCSSGGMRMDYAQLSRFSIQSVSDQTDYRRNALVASGAATAVLPEQAAIWAYPLAENDDNAIIFNMVNAMLLRIHLSGEIHKMSGGNFALVREAIECYLKINNDIPNAIPFYPLGLPHPEAQWLCVAYKCGSCIRMAIWRMASEKESITVPLDFDIASVNVLYPSRSNYCAAKSGNGISVSLPDKFCAALIEIKY